jgi:hypothetical protein
MRPKVLVLGTYDRPEQGRRNTVNRDPTEPANLEVGSADVEQRAASIQKITFRRLPIFSDLVEAGNIGWGRHNYEHDDGSREEETSQQKEASDHGFASTTIGSFGSIPNISGAYIASTRVAGMLNLPGLLSRAVYSTDQVPFGTNR